jgi:hypothetical protein
MSDNDNHDMLDLCRFNMMEDNIQGSPAVDRDITLKAIDIKKRQLVVRLINQAVEPAAKDQA